VDLTQTLLHLALVGSSWVLWLLLGLSVASVAMMIHKSLVFYRQRFNEAQFTAHLQPLLEQQDWERLISGCEAQPGLELQVLTAGLRQIHRGKDAVQEAMEGERIRVAIYLERGLSFLGTLGANAPFIGLFGTVLGIIHSFRALGHADSFGGPMVMAGIAEALVATAVGLLVAIPAVVMYNLFHRRLHVVLERARRLERLLLTYLPGSAADLTMENNHYSQEI